jgi:hypothetical protein
MSSISPSRDRLSGKLVQAMRNRPLLSFFVLAYAVTWLLQSPL